MAIREVEWCEKGIRGRRASFINRMLLSLMCAMPLLALAAETQPQAVILFPEMRQPYSKVFEDIIAGISVSFAGEVNLMPVSDSRVFSGLVLADESQPDVVIALGKRGYEAAVADSSSAAPVVLAGVSGIEPLPYPGISVLPHPLEVFAKLRMLAPSVNSVHVLIRTSADNGYSQLIYEAAVSESLQITLHKCVDFHDCAEAVGTVTNSGMGVRDGLWLADSGAVDNAILGLILERAWSNRFVVMSNNPAHVRRGVLFALYPDNQKMGETLGSMANRVIANGGNSEGILPLRDVKLAVNLRTGSHIGVVFDRNIRSQIDLAFPSD